jgi:hypothetical protein
MDPDGQYLATLRAFLQQERPHWDRAVDTYIRMRCVGIVMDETAENSAAERHGRM